MTWSSVFTGSFLHHNCSFISSDLSVAVWIISSWVLPWTDCALVCLFISFVWSSHGLHWLNRKNCWNNASHHNFTKPSIRFCRKKWITPKCYEKLFSAFLTFFCPLSVFVPCFPLLPVTASESETSCSWLHIDKDTAGLGLHVANGSSFIYASLLVRQPSSGADGGSVQLDSAIEPFVIGTWNEVPH